MNITVCIPIASHYNYYDYDNTIIQTISYLLNLRYCQNYPIQSRDGRMQRRRALLPPCVKMWNYTK